MMRFIKKIEHIKLIYIEAKELKHYTYYHYQYL